MKSVIDLVWDGVNGKEGSVIRTKRMKKIKANEMKLIEEMSARVSDLQVRVQIRVLIMYE